MARHEKPEEPTEGYRVGNQDPKERGLGKTADQMRKEAEAERNREK